MNSKRLIPALLLAVLALGCRDPEPPVALLRLSDLLPDGPDQRLSLPVGVTVEEERVTVPVDFEAPQVTALEIRAAGEAAQLRLNWRLEGERKFYYQRAQTLALKPDGEARSYPVDLLGHRAWAGRVVELRLTAKGGTVDVREIVAHVPGSPYRDIVLSRLLVPAVSGRQRLEIELPPRLPRQAVFEARLGVLEALRSSGATARFRASVEKAGTRVLFLEEELGEQDAGWRTVSRQVDLAGASTLVLEVSSAGPPGLAFWGHPRLVFEPIAPAMNLLVIAIDTLRADVLGAYGDTDGLSPHIDRLARRSVRFADHTVPSPWTLPSFASLLTGLQPQTHGAGRREEAASGVQKATRLARSVPTLAEVLARSGLVTAAFYNNPFLGRPYGLHRGFDEHRRYETPVRAARVVDGALRWLDENGDRRFFLFVHLFDPHGPYRPPASYCREVARRLEPGYAGDAGCQIRSAKDGRVEPADRAWAQALYRAEVAYTDAQVGRLLAALDGQAYGERTAVLLVGDHGEGFWNRLDHSERLGYEPWADHGHNHFRELLHTPALLSVPGLDAREIEAPVETVDLFPTLLGYLGVPAPRHQGRDLGELIAGGSLPEPLRISDFLLYGPPRWAARQGPWKLVVKPEDDPVLELYNLAEDPEEARDASSRYQRLAGELFRAAAEEIAIRGEKRLAWFGDDDAPALPSEEELEQLRTLGYIE